MGFTYDLTSDIGKVRLLIGDTVINNGVKPDGTNYSDEEIQVFLTRNENDSDIAAAEALENLARMWAVEPDVKMGPVTESRSDVARNLRYQALALRDQVGGDATAFSVGFVRDDGYAEADEEQEYYGS